MIRARVQADQTGSGGRVVTTMVMWPAAGTGVDVRCYTPEEPEIEDAGSFDSDPADRASAPPVYVAPEGHRRPSLTPTASTTPCMACAPTWPHAD